MPIPLEVAIGCALETIPDTDLPRIQAALEAHLAYQRTHQIERYFPDTGRYRRELYPKHLAFFAAGKSKPLRLFSAGNRVGKSRAGCCEDEYHSTGRYPAWWEGRRFRRPVKLWVCGTTDEKVKESVQLELLGPPNDIGTGLIPLECIERIDYAPGAIKDLVDTVWIRHETDGVFDGLSQLTFKSYKQGRKAYEGTKMDIIHNDEECPIDIMSEQILRLADTEGRGEDGILYNTVTPMEGLTETFAYFLPDGQFPDEPQEGDKYVVSATWDDVPHLSARTKAMLRATIPAYQLTARSRGIPVLGEGVIYPVDEETYLVDPFELPKHWLRCYGMDVGWNRTAVIWGGYDPDADTWYLYHEYYGAQEKPTTHGAGIRAPGDWIPGVIDPAARGRSQKDGQALFDLYTTGAEGEEGQHLKLAVASNAVEAGIYQVWERLSTGRLKVFRSLSHWRKEVRLYQRVKGKVLKKDDHLMDSTRYLILSGLDYALPFPVPAAPKVGQPAWRAGRGGWMRA